jgi:hypothetical protein
MNMTIYEVKEHIGLRPGQLGPGNPDALYKGSRVLGSRIEEDLPRLIELEAVAIANNQSDGESILESPMTDKTVKLAPVESKGSNSPEGDLESLTAVQLRELATSLGIDVPTNANKAAIKTLIETANATKKADPLGENSFNDGSGDDDVQGTVNN